MVPELTHVWFHRVTDPTDPVGSRRSELVQWRPGLTAGDVARRGRIFRNGIGVDRDAIVEPGDHVTAIDAVGGPVGAFLAQYLISAIVAAGVGYLVSKLLGVPKPSATPEDNESATYGWSGLRTNYAANGQAIPVVIGEHLVGGLCIGKWVEVTAQTDANGVIIDQKSVLRLLLLLSQGPIEAIGDLTADADNLTGSQLPRGLQINDNAAENFSGVKASIRLGGLDQTAIPGFSALRKMHVVGLLVDNLTSGTPVTDWSLAAAFDLPDAADQALIGIGFPFGLYSLSGSTLASEAVIIEVRYIELDGGGSPVGSWVVPALFDDGSTNPITITGKVQGELVKQLPITFFNPATYVPQAAGQAMLCRKTKGFLRTTNLNGTNVGYTSNTILDRISVEIFYRYVQGLAGGIGRERVLWSWCYASVVAQTNGSYDTTLGLVQGISVKWTDSDPSGSNDNVGLEIELGNGTLSGAANQGHTQGWQRFVIPGLFQIANGNQKFGQVVVTYERLNDGNGTRVLTVYHDGLQVFQRSDSTASGGGGGANGIPIVKTPTSDAAARRFYLGSAHQMTGFASGTIYDQTRIWKRVLSSAEVASAWSNGVPVGGLLIGQQASQLVAFWSMNTASLSGQTGSGTQLDPWHTGTFADASGNDLDLSIFDILGGTGGVETQTGFVLDSAPVQQPKRARYRIQVQRRDLVRDGTTVRDLCKLDHVMAVEDAALEYPERALLGMEILADEQLNSSEPNVRVPVKGVRLPIWDGVDPQNPNVSKVWSANPAWALAAAITEHWGLGSIYQTKHLDVESLAEWAAWCDELVWDQHTPLVVLQINYGTWPVGSALAALYPDGYMEIVGDFDSIADTLPDQFEVDYPIKLTGTVGGGAPSWAQTVVDGGPYTLVEVDLQTSFPDDTVRVPWPSALVAVPPSPTSWVMSTTSSDIDMEGREARARCDLVLDRRTENAQDQLIKIAAAGRGVPIKAGKWRAKFERARTPVQLFSSANIVPGSFKFSLRSEAESFNSAVAEIADRERNYERQPVVLQHKTLRDATLAQSVRERGFSFEGITRRSQATRELRFLLNVAHVIRMLVEFKTSIEGAFVEVGDVVLVAHDLPLWAFSGRCRDTSQSASEIIIDRQVILAAATTYRCAVRAGTDDSLSDAEVSSPAGTYEPGDVIALTAPLAFTPAQDDLWAIGQFVRATKQFQIVHGSLDGDANRMLRLVEYDPDVYDETGFADLPPVITGLDIPSAASTPGAPLTLLGNDGSGTDEDLGVYRKRLDLSWQYAPRDLGRIAGADIWIAEEPTDGSLASDYLQVGSVRGRINAFRLAAQDLKIGTTYRVKVQPIGRDGSRLDIARIPGAMVKIQGRAIRANAPVSIAVVQAGDLIGYVVNQPVAGIASSVELRRGGWILGDRVATLGVQSDLGGFSHNWVAAPEAADGRGHPTIFARNTFTNLQRSAALLIGFEPDLSMFEAVLLESSVEDDGWDAGSPAPELTNLAIDTSVTPPRLTFTGSATTGIYQTTDFVLSEPRLVHVSLAWEADQVHPRTWNEFEDLAGGSLIHEANSGPLQVGQTGGKIVGGRTPAQGFEDAWDSAFNRSWTWEGPTDSLHSEVTRTINGNASIRVQMAFSTDTDPGTGFMLYSPGYYFLRSVRFQVTITRRDDTYDAWLTRMAVALRARLSDVIDGGVL